jgi:lipopolysaccharide transport system ATP-binding protein
LIAEPELSKRFGAVTLHRFSYNAKTPPDWPFSVTSVSELPHMVRDLHGLLIGGGFLIRFDKDVAPGYGPPSPTIHHPTGYWLTPALLAHQHNVPVVWNAAGMHENEIPKWADPLIRLALSQSYVAVRDDRTRTALEPFSDGPIDVVPDTAFGISRLLATTPSTEFERVCEASQLTDRYIVVQSTLGAEPFVRFLMRHADRLRGFSFLTVPMGPVLGEQAAIVDATLPGSVRLTKWPSPLLLAELIARSEAVVGHSYHLCITALASGVPVFTWQDLSTGKYAALRHFETVFPLPSDAEPDLDWFLARVGRTTPCEAARATLAPLDKHWDRVATVVRAGPTTAAHRMSRFWQSLPGLLESVEADHTSTDLLVQVDEMMRRLASAHEDLAARGADIAALKSSTSWTITAPVRFLGRQLRRMAVNKGRGS